MRTLGQKLLTYSGIFKNTVIGIFALIVATILALSLVTDVDNSVEAVERLTPSITKIIGIQ